VGCGTADQEEKTAEEELRAVNSRLKTEDRRVGGKIKADGCRAGGRSAWRKTWAWSVSVAVGRVDCYVKKGKTDE